jgi:hypothetical protein
MQLRLSEMPRDDQSKIGAWRPPRWIFQYRSPPKPSASLPTPKNSNGIADANVPVYIGTGLAYKESVRPQGDFIQREKPNGNQEIHEASEKGNQDSTNIGFEEKVIAGPVGGARAPRRWTNLDQKGLPSPAAPFFDFYNVPTSQECCVRRFLHSASKTHGCSFLTAFVYITAVFLCRRKRELNAPGRVC